MNKYVVIISCGGFFKIFPKKWLHNEDKKIFCPTNYDKLEVKSKAFQYRHTSKDGVIISGSLFTLWRNPYFLLNEKKYPYFYKKTHFSVYYWLGGFFDWSHRRTLPINERNKLYLIDRKVMGFGAFLSYLSIRSKKEGSLTWEVHTKQHFMRKKNKNNTLPRRVPKIGAKNIIKRLNEMIEIFKKGDKPKITKLLPLVKLEDHIGYEVTKNFIYYLMEVVYEECYHSSCPEKQALLDKGLAIAKSSLLATEKCDISLPRDYRDFDEAATRVSFLHPTKIDRLNDSDVILYRCTLKWIFEHTYRSKHLIYEAGKFFCCDYSECKVTYTENSPKRVEKLLKFMMEGKS